MGRIRQVAFVWGVLALSGLGLAGPAALAQSAGGARIVGERPLAGNGIELTIATPAFSSGQSKVQVFLPAGYHSQPDRSWPVTYYLHGAAGDQTRFWAWYGDLIKGFPSIVVAPDGGMLGYYTDWYNGGAGGPPEYETYEIDQLIPLIDQRFRTVGTRAGRAVIGESMGGYGVMTYAARHPDVFATAVSLSGAVDNNSLPYMALLTASSTVQKAATEQTAAPPDGIYGPRATQEIRWHGHNPTDLAANLRDVLLQVRGFDGAPTPLIEGGPDSAVGCSEEREVHDESVSFHDQLLADGITHVWKDYGPGCHGSPEFRREFSDSLPGIEDVFAHPQSAPKTFSYESIEPRFDIWRWNVAADPARALEFLQMRHAGRHGLTLVGSGTTSVTTPPFFRGVDAVDVVTSAGTRTLSPDSHGRLRFSVDLGAPHADQQDTAAARLDGQDAAGYFTTRTVKLVAR
jgi:S-formylglutathione hydrolase FrmB